jgi:hypothetical protein
MLAMRRSRKRPGATFWKREAEARANPALRAKRGRGKMV